MKAIPLDVGLKLCGEIRQENQGKWLSLARLQCWGCMMASKADASKMCVASRPDGHGCNLVNGRYTQQSKGA